MKNEKLRMKESFNTQHDDIQTIVYIWNVINLLLWSQAQEKRNIGRINLI